MPLRTPTLRTAVLLLALAGPPGDARPGHGGGPPPPRGRPPGRQSGQPGDPDAG
jgi:hypothetical protein